MILRVRHMKIAATAAALLVALLLAGPARAAPRTQQIDPAEFSPTITNPLFPLASTGPKVFEGESIDPDTGETTDERLESAVLPETVVVAGVTVTVLEEKAFEDGELVERALDYFAQHDNGDVYYFGERVDNYEDGVLRDHAGQWLAGENGARPGVIMAAEPQIGVTYEQELAPGVAEDKSTVLALDETVQVPSGSYTGCLKTREFTPLESGVEEFKWHCPGVGLVQEQGAGSMLQLVSISPGAAPSPTPTHAATGGSPTPAPSGITAPSTGTGGEHGEGSPLAALITLFAAAAALRFALRLRRIG